MYSKRQDAFECVSEKVILSSDSEREMKITDLCLRRVERISEGWIGLFNPHRWPFGGQKLGEKSKNAQNLHFWSKNSFQTIPWGWIDHEKTESELRIEVWSLKTVKTEDFDQNPGQSSTLAWGLISTLFKKRYARGASVFELACRRLAKGVLQAPAMHSRRWIIGYKRR